MKELQEAVETICRALTLYEKELQIQFCEELHGSNRDYVKAACYDERARALNLIKWLSRKEANPDET